MTTHSLENLNGEDANEKAKIRKFTIDKYFGISQGRKGAFL